MANDDHINIRVDRRVKRLAYELARAGDESISRLVRRLIVERYGQHDTERSERRPTKRKEPHETHLHHQAMPAMQRRNEYELQPFAAHRLAGQVRYTRTVRTAGAKLRRCVAELEPKEVTYERLGMCSGVCVHHCGRCRAHRHLCTNRHPASIHWLPSKNTPYRSTDPYIAGNNRSSLQIRAWYSFPAASLPASSSSLP